MPSGIEMFSLLFLQLIFVKIFPVSNRLMISIYTILLSTIFAGVTVCIHTSVNILPAILLLPMMLTPLYKNGFLTALQAILVVLIYILSHFYFVPNAPYTPPVNVITPYVDLSVFIGAVLSIYFILQRVNLALVLNEELSKRDSLTHLYNHENFYVKLNEFQKLYERNHVPFSILVADIDDFKKVNDTFGHAFGDEVICKVGDLFSEYGEKHAFCARYGGEEFAMILPVSDPTSIAEEIRKAFSDFPFETADGKQHFTLSIGVAIYDQTYTSASAFFEQADNALYAAKKNGKNCVVKA